MIIAVVSFGGPSAVRLAVRVDNTFLFDRHVNNVIMKCNYQLHALRHIRASFTEEIANMMACSIIGSVIDYFNSLFWNVCQEFK